MVGRKRNGSFKDVKLKVMRKISNSQHKRFSSGGKEVLIKVGQAILAYIMSVFKIPIGNLWWYSESNCQSGRDPKRKKDAYTGQNEKD